MKTYFDYIMSKKSWRWQLTDAPEKCEARIRKSFDKNKVDTVFATWFLQRQVFDSGQVYKLGAEFEEILETADLKVDANNLSVHDWSYVQLNQERKVDDKWSYDSFIYRITDRYLTFMIMLKDKNGYTVHSLGLGVPLTSGFNIDSLPIEANSAPVCSPDKESMEDMTHRVARIALYIGSGNPDLRHLKAPSAGKWEKNRTNDNDVTCSDVILVGFGWKKSQLYSVESSLVKAHLRWQPCGVGRQQVKLVIVREHTRTYKNVSV